MALALVLAGTAQGHSLINCAAVSNLRGLSDNDPHAMIDQHAGANLCSGMDFDAGQKPGRLADHTGGEKVFVFIKPMGRAVQHNRMQAG